MIISVSTVGHTKNLTIDHVIPRSKGGKDTWENLVACCASCNIKKGSKYLHETNMMIRRKPVAPINRVIFELQKSKVDEWQEFIFE